MLDLALSGDGRASGDAYRSFSAGRSGESPDQVRVPQRIAREHAPHRCESRHIACSVRFEPHANQEVNVTSFEMMRRRVAAGGAARRAQALLAATGIAAAGCWRTTTTTIRVRDPGQVVLEQAAEPVPVTVVPSGSSASVPIATGRWFEPFHFVRYEIRAVRDRAGTLSLHCDACGNARYPLAGISDRQLVSARGEVAPTIGAVDLSLASSAIVANHDTCLVTAPLGDTTTCEAEVRSRLVIPWTNVIEVHRHHEPSRWWGKWLIAMGVVGLAFGGVALSPWMNGLTTGERAGWALGFMVPSSLVLSAGLWDVYAPARDEYVSPDHGQSNWHAESKHAM